MFYNPREQWAKFRLTTADHVELRAMAKQVDMGASDLMRLSVDWGLEINDLVEADTDSPANKGQTLALTIEQLNYLEAEAQRRGVTVATMLRRMLEMFIREANRIGVDVLVAATKERMV